MGLRADPVGGGQFKQAVKAIIEAESQPVKALEKKKTKEDTRLKLFQEFKTKFTGLDKAIGDLATFKKFRELKADLGDGSNLMSVTLDKDKAEVGQYTIEVDSLASKTSVITNGFKSADDNFLGMGFVTFSQANGESVDVYVDDKNSSLQGVASLINRQSNSPVHAAVIRDESDTDAPWKILFTAKKDGSGNQVDYPEFYFMDAADDIYVDDDKEAKNGVVVVDGFEIETAGNDINDFLPGINAHFKQAKSGQPFTLSVTEDYQKMSGKVKGLVDAMNQVLEFITKQNTVDANSDTTTTFAGDTGLQSLEFQLRNIIHQNYMTGGPGLGPTGSISLSEIGIEFEKTGQLKFKEEKFNKTLETNFDSTAQAITGPSGFANRLRSLFETYTRPGTGMFSAKEAGIQSRIKAIDEQIDQKTRIIEKKKQDITNKFARLESTISDMQRQQQYLSAALPGAGAGGGVGQLLSTIS